jgi:hypothetical protein
MNVDRGVGRIYIHRIRVKVTDIEKCKELCNDCGRKSEEERFETIIIAILLGMLKGFMMNPD